MSLIGMGAEQINQRHLLQRQRLAGHFLDRLKKLALIQRLGAATEVQQEVAQRSDHYRLLIMKTLKVAFLSSAVLEFFSSVAIAAVAIYIGFSLFGAISFGPAASLTLSSGLFILALAPVFSTAAPICPGVS
ncbi:ABC transporter transmembrane domain-containing protein [Alishewanella longhuensis]